MSNIIVFENIINNYKFTLDKYILSDNYIIYLLYNNNIIKIITDFNIFAIAKSEYYDLTQFNINIIFNDKTPQNILNYLKANLIEKTNHDVFNLHINIDSFSKVSINYKELSKSLNNNILLQDIKNINNNKNYIHYIDSNLVVYINNNIKFKLLISNTYPKNPPKIELISPHFTFDFSTSFMNLDILKHNNWKSSITLEQLILEIAKINFNDYIIDNNEYNTTELELIKLISITENNKINILINITNIKDTNNKYWKSGTGYSSSDTGDSYIQNSDVINTSISILSKIIISDIDNYIDIIYNYINNRILGLSLLELYSHIDLYILIFELVKILYNKISNDMILKLSINLKNLYDELKNIILTDTSNDIMNIYNIIKLYKPIENIIIDNNNNNDYIDIMRKLQFGTYTLPYYHKFYDKRNEKINKKSMIRMLSEISSLKNNLPLSNDSSIWIKIPENSYNVMTVLISGPSNTPYEHGLFEFHCYLPSDYPNKPPEVLLYTTGNGTVRFNPNLYNNGKVCLSLLGTWEGGHNEKWNPESSTILQVLVSIQSLILIDDPFYNEPGWEKLMGTESGNIKSLEYNNNLYPNTIKFAMIEMIKKPPIGFEDIVNNHFKLNNNKIIKTINKWKELNNNIDLNEINLLLQ